MIYPTSNSQIFFERAYSNKWVEEFEIERRWLYKVLVQPTPLTSGEYKKIVVLKKEWGSIIPFLTHDSIEFSSIPPERNLIKEKLDQFLVAYFLEKIKDYRIKRSRGFFKSI